MRCQASRLSGNKCRYSSLKYANCFSDSVSGAKVVYLGWNGGLNSALMAGLYEHYRITPKAFNNSPEMRQWLTDKGLQYLSLPRKGQWRVSFVKEELAEQCSNMLVNYGAA